MDSAREALRFLEGEINKTEKRTVLSFEEYLELIRREPERVLRNIFLLFHSMVKAYVGPGEDEYPNDPESIGFVKYDCSKLLVEGADVPFLADTLFANRFIRQVESLRQGFQQNRIYVYEGRSGCGKSTFLNNLLRTFEAYTSTKEGQTYELLWVINEKALLGEDAPNASQEFFVPCPSHDYPILVIPREYRSGLLDKLLPEDSDIKKRIFRNKEYEWLFKGEVCTICKSIFWSLFEKLGSFDKVFSMIKARTCKFDRRVGDGVSIFNPGDKPSFGGGAGAPMPGYFGNKQIQERLDHLFGVNAVRYIFSPLAKTNNGIYVLMDVKAHNRERLLELHNVISEGVHKIGEVEEQITSLFFALMNPEDNRVFEEDKMESFQGRIDRNKMPYVLEPATEVNIYRNIFGEGIDQRFLPRVLENFARVIISSRLNSTCEPLKNWIPDLKKYHRYCDEWGFLLRMEIYSNVIPPWLTEEDRKKFNAPIRRALIAAGASEGDCGFDGRESLKLFNDFFGPYSTRANLITLENVVDFFKTRIDRALYSKHIRQSFIDSLVGSYDYAVLNEVKEALYFYNKAQVSRDILNYLCAINYDVGSKIKCGHTGEKLEVTVDFLKIMAGYLAGRDMSDEAAVKYAQDIQKRYVVIVARGADDIAQTDLYRELFDAYTRNLKERVLQPFLRNTNFREAVKTFGTKEFQTFDTRLREYVSHMIGSLVAHHGYTEQGAQEICLYVLDKNLASKFS